MSINDGPTKVDPTIATRPEKITQFLSHAFPTERDRLYFELVMDSFLWDSDDASTSDRIELELSNYNYFEKYISLREKRNRELDRILEKYDDSRTPDKTLGYIHDIYDTVIIDFYPTLKPKKRQMNFINRLCKAKFKERYGEAYRNTNSYVFIVKESLFKNGGFKGNGIFTSYSLKKYNDDDYIFTDNDKENYNVYLSNLRQVMRVVYRNKWPIHNVLNMIDIYLETVNKTEQK